MFGLFKRKPTQDEIEDAIEGKGGIDEDEDAFVIDNSEEEKELFFEGMLSQYVNPLFGPKFWQEPRKFSVYTNGLVEKERLKGSKHRFSTVNRLSFTLDSNTTLKKIVPEDADMQQFVFVVSCTVFSSRNSIFAADITAAPRIVKYMFRAFSKASYYEWLYKIKHIMDNTWMADQAVAKFGKNLGFRIRAIPKLKASSLVESKEDEKNANELGEEETVEVDLEAVEQERKRRNKKRRRRRHANMKLLLPNQTDFSIALEQRHYDSREQGGEILNLFLSHLERNILVADKVIGAREWRQRMNVVEARNKAKAEAAAASAKKRKGKNRSAPKSRQRPLVGNNEAKEGKEEEEEEDDEEEEDIETVEGDDGGGEGEGKEEPERPSIWRFLPSLPSLSLLGFVSKEEKEAAEQEEQRKKKEERQKERDERARRRHDEPSTAVFLVRLRRAVYKNTMVVRALTVPRGPYRNGLYYRVFTEDGRLVVEYDPMYVWMNLDSIGKEMTGEVRRDWGQSEAEGRRDQGYDGASDFDSDLMSTDESDNNGSDSDGGGSGSDDGEGWSSDDDVGGEAFEQEQSDDEEAGGTDTLVATSRDGLPSVSLSSPGDLRKGNDKDKDKETSSTSTATLSSSSGQDSLDRPKSADKSSGALKGSGAKRDRSSTRGGGTPAILATLTPSPRATSLPRQLQQLQAPQPVSAVSSSRGEAVHYSSVGTGARASYRAGTDGMGDLEPSSSDSDSQGWDADSGAESVSGAVSPGFI